ASLATWRAHESYTSKALCQSPLKWPGPADPPARPPNTILDSMQPSPAPQSQTDCPVSVEDAIKGALQGLESHVEAFAAFLLETSRTLRTVAENTREADVVLLEALSMDLRASSPRLGKWARPWWKHSMPTLSYLRQAS